MTNDEVVIWNFERMAAQPIPYYSAYWDGKPVIVGKKRVYLRKGDLMNRLVRSVSNAYIGKYPNQQQFRLSKADAKTEIDILIKKGILEIKTI